jgi:hypothetical protein
MTDTVLSVAQGAERADLALPGVARFARSLGILT